MPAINEGREELPDKHVSVSQLNRYRRCGYQDYLYFKHGPMAPGVSQTKGTVVHDLGADNLRMKRDHGSPLELEAIPDMAADRFEATVAAKGLRLTDDENQVGEKKILSDAKDWTIHAAVVHSTRVVPQIDADLVEASIVSESPMPELDDHYLVGRIDVADTSRRVRDLKSTGSKGTVSQRVADTSPQLSIYAALYFMATQELPQSVVLDGVFVGQVKKDGTRSTDYVVASSGREWSQINSVLESMGTLVKARNAGIFMPVDASGPSGWVCMQKWCGYTNICPHYRKERG